MRRNSSATRHYAWAIGLLAAAAWGAAGCGANGSSCSVKDNTDGTAVITCTDGTSTTIKGAAYSYKVLAERGSPAYWDEHGTSAQRFFNYLCIAYGSPYSDAFKSFVDAGLLPPARALHCKEEYAQVDKAFRRYILPHINRDLMKTVQETDWLPKSTGR